MIKRRWHLKYDKIYKTKEEAIKSAKGFEKYGWKTQVRNIEHLVGIRPWKWGVYLNGEKH